jgi:hypothetical protein
MKWTSWGLQVKDDKVGGEERVRFIRLFELLCAADEPDKLWNGKGVLV